MYCHLIFSEGAKSIQRGKNGLFKKCCWDNWISTYKKKNEFGYYLTLHIKIDSEWNNLNIRAKTVILLEENIG